MTTSWKFVLPALILFVCQSTYARWEEREEFRFSGASYSTTQEVVAASKLDFGNSYGDIVIKVRRGSGTTVKISGTYSSESSNWGGLQLLTKQTGRYEVFVDGPAKFKSHDHVGDYGKPLDMDWFESHVGQHGIRQATAEDIEQDGGLEEGDILVGGGAFVLFKKGGFSMRVGYGGSRGWGTASFGGEGVEIHDGHCYGLEEAQVTMVVEVPASAIGKLKASVKEGSKVTVEYPDGEPGGFNLKQTDDHRLELTRDDCGSETM